MAELATIARPYAEALFRVAQSGNLSAWSDLVAEMAQAGAHPDVQALAHNPKSRLRKKLRFSCLRSNLQ
jgi:F-type H+-transporting ATPase subunit delta